jgi:ribonucleoside-diphosphate reductase alpha chain
MEVVKRDGSRVPVLFDKISRRISNLCNGLENVNVIKISKDVINQLCNGVKTSDLDRYTANVCGSLIMEHPDHDTLASRILVSNNQKSTPTTFSKATEILFKEGVVNEKYAKFVANNAKVLNQTIDHALDFDISYFGFKTLEKSYLLKDTQGNVVERFQYLLMRLSVAFYLDSGPNELSNIIKSYIYMSKKAFTHATPTMFNAGTKRQQCSSCFLMGIDDSIEGIMDTVKDAALISKYSGGLGMHISNIRSNGSLIRGTNGQCTGIVKMLKVFESVTDYVNQSGKRNGSMCVYLEPWHGDIEDFLDLRRTNGAEEVRARKLFYALWVCDLFMKRVKDDGIWSLMCPNTCSGLSDCHGKAFEDLYQDYEEKGMFVKQIKARELWVKILNVQIETGMPYMLYKDNVNNKSSLQDFGTIKSSNLCAEIVEHSNQGKEIAVCNLASVCLPQVLGKELNFSYLREVVQQIVKNINRVIDINFYPVKTAENANMYHRPMGIGVQGLADLLIMHRLAYDSEEACKLNALIFEHMYYAALDMSCTLAEERNEKFGSYEKSMYPKGILQFHMWKGAQVTLDWNPLIERIKKHGVLNSQLIALMPTASTSQIMGFTESFEPITSNIFKRKTLAGEFIVVNRELVKELQENNLWNKDTIQQIILDRGSVKNIQGLSEETKNIFKTVWEIKQKSIINMAAARGPFVDQSQSMNLYMSKPDQNILSAMHFYGWEKGLKTGMYYLRSRPSAEPDKITVNASKMQEACSSGACSA